jgi:hypothetical protein
MPCSYIINFKGGEQVAVKTTGCEKLHVYDMFVTLFITTNGNKLPPYVMLNSKTVPEENFCKDVIVWTQKMHG